MADDTEHLWPIGSNKQLLYAIGHYFQFLLKHHGIKLNSEKLIKIQKLRDGLKSLLESVNNGDSIIHDINFTLPGIYQLWEIPKKPLSTSSKCNNNNNNNHSMSSSINSLKSTPSPSNSISVDLSSSTSPNDISLFTAAKSINNNNNNNNDNTQKHPQKQNQQEITIKSDIDNIDNDKYAMFDSYLFKLSLKNNKKISKLSPKYLSFLQNARKQYNEQIALNNDRFVIKSLDDIPSLKYTLYQIRYSNNIKHIDFTFNNNNTLNNEYEMIDHIDAYSINGTRTSIITKRQKGKHQRGQSAKLSLNTKTLINRRSKKMSSPPPNSNSNSKRGKTPPPKPPKKLHKITPPPPPKIQINNELNLNLSVCDDNKLFGSKKMNVSNHGRSLSMMTTGLSGVSGPMVNKKKVDPLMMELRAKLVNRKKSSTFIENKSDDDNINPNKDDKDDIIDQLEDIKQNNAQIDIDDGSNDDDSVKINDDSSIEEEESDDDDDDDNKTSLIINRPPLPAKSVYIVSDIMRIKHSRPLPPIPKTKKNKFNEHTMDQIIEENELSDDEQNINNDVNGFIKMDNNNNNDNNDNNDMNNDDNDNDNISLIHKDDNDTIVEIDID